MILWSLLHGVSGRRHLDQEVTEAMALDDKNVSGYVRIRGLAKTCGSVIKSVGMAGQIIQNKRLAEAFCGWNLPRHFYFCTPICAGQRKPDRYNQYFSF